MTGGKRGKGKRGGRGGRKGGRGEASSHSLSENVKADETIERKDKRQLNVLVLGHTGAGKSLTLRNIEKFEKDRIVEKTSEKFEKIRLLEQATEKKEDKLEGSDHHERGKKVALGEVKYETKTSIFHFLEAPIDYRYVPNLMSKAMQADIAILFVSASEDKDEITDEEKAIQSNSCVQLILTLVIKKVLVVVNKLDTKTCKRESYEEIESNTTSFLEKLGFKAGRDVKFLPLSAKKGWNFQTKMDKKICAWFEGPCFFEALDAFEVPARVNETPDSKWNADIFNLVNVDLLIDKNPSDGESWLSRSKTLIRLIHYTAAFEASEKAAQYECCPTDEKKSVASLLTKGHYYRIKGEFGKAIEIFNVAKELYHKDDNSIALNLLNEQCFYKIWEVWGGNNDKEKSSLVIQEPSSYNEEVPTLAFEERPTLALEEEPTLAVEEMQEEHARLNDSPQKGKEIIDSGIKEKTVKTEVHFLLENEVGSRMYEGRKANQFFDHQKSFIEAKESQMDSYEDLLDITSNSRFFVSIEEVIRTPDNVSYLVVQSVIPLNSFFDVELTLFRNENTVCDEEAKSRWWRQISRSFKRIFGDVIHGLMYLYSKGHICGDLINYIYVNHRGEGKILSLMNKDKQQGYDIQNLVKKMKEIITYPFPNSEIDNTYNLPVELIHLLRFVDKQKLKHFPFYWLVNHPFFWSIEERITFIRGFRKLLKGKILLRSNINEFLVDYAHYYASYIDEKGDINWSTAIDVNVHDGLFHLILNYSREGGTSTHYDFESPCDIVRYMCNCYSHADDSYYKDKMPDQNFSISDEDIEGALRSFFPSIYIDLYNAIYDYADFHGSNDIFRALEKWSSLYFAPEVIQQEQQFD